MCVCLSVCPSVCLSVCLLVCLSPLLLQCSASRARSGMMAILQSVQDISILHTTIWNLIAELHKALKRAHSKRARSDITGLMATNKNRKMLKASVFRQSYQYAEVTKCSPLPCLHHQAGLQLVETSPHAEENSQNMR